MEMEHLEMSSQIDCHAESRISLIGHCVICLRKGRKGQVTSEDGEDELSESEITLNSRTLINSPGFQKTFNDIWSVLEINRRKDKQSSCNEGITLETVMMEGEGSKGKYEKSLGTLTMCQLCCEKVMGVENLMKAVRQQVREISMLVKESRRVGGRLDQFEKALRDNVLEADVIQATLDFIHVFDKSKGLSRDGDSDNAMMETGLMAAKNEDEDFMDCEDDEKGSATEAEDEEDSRSIGPRENELEDDNSDSDYIKSEEDDDDDDVVVITSGEEEEEIPLDKVICYDKTDPLANPGPIRKSTKRKQSKSVVVLVQEGSSSKTLVCDVEGESTSHGLEYIRPRGSWLLLDQEQPCDMCGEIVRLSHIFTHLSSHVGADFIVKCPNDKCHRMFSNVVGFRNHFRTNNECNEVAKKKEFGLSCDKCGFKADKRVVLRKHVENIHENIEGGGGSGSSSSSEKKWKCPMSGCGKRFAVKQSVHLHLEVHRKIRRLTTQKCDKCGESLDVTKMEEHLKRGHGVKEVIGCKQCEFKFSGRDELVEHLYQHRTVGILCDLCNGKDDKQGKFSKYAKFREHYFGEHQLCPKKFKCEEEDCGALFWRKFDTIYHKIRCHDNSSVEKTFGCELCVDSNVSFKYAHSLVSHKIRIHGAEPYKCEICGEACTSKSHMYVHMKGHQGKDVNKFECKVEGCGVVFKCKKSWKRHMDIVHNGMEKARHVCKECGKGYSEQSTLKLHRDRVHLGKRQWVCGECGENFANGNILEVHKLIHTRERPFVCELCGQRFRQRVVLRRHLRGHEEKGKDFKPNGPMKGIRKRKANESL